MAVPVESEERSGFPIAFIIGIVVVAFIVGAITLTARLTSSKTPQGEQHLPFGSTEQAAASRIHFLEPQMGRASNFLNQDVTYIGGVMENSGVDGVQDVEVTMEFHDPFNQVVLRETRRLFAPNARATYAGERRDFQVSLEYVPAQWDQRYPTIRVTGLLLAK